MNKLRTGLYRTGAPHPHAPEQLPAQVLVYVGERDGALFAVRPHRNHHNRWFWQDPVYRLDDADLAENGWSSTLLALPAEGFYVLPRTLTFPGGARWLEGAIVQLGYRSDGKAIIFVAEHDPKSDANVLFFASHGQPIDDALLHRLRWAPILPVPAQGGSRGTTLH